MTNPIGQWRFINESMGGESQLCSFSHGVELLLDVAKKEMAESVCFQNCNGGAILCVAGIGFATLAFNPKYDERAHSLVGFHRALPAQRANLENFYFVDDTETVSSIDVEELLPILDVVRAVIYILENHDYPKFLQWRQGC